MGYVKKGLLSLTLIILFNILLHIAVVKSIRGAPAPLKTNLPLPLGKGKGD
jgi:hypothetical protein